MTGPVARTPLLKPGWTQVEATHLEDVRATEWTLLAAQRRVFDAEQQASHVLRLLEASAGDPSFGYQVNNYRHSLQAATAALQDGRDEEYVVVALFHDVGFTACPSSHGLFAAALLGPYISEANRWLLAHHQIFLAQHYHDHPDEALDRDARERWRGHPHFEATAEFVQLYDAPTIAPDRPEAPIATFVPMLTRLLARPPRPLPPA
jgi:predicted HD phosphohydrolase